jgi:hypothetical protein
MEGILLVAIGIGCVAFVVMYFLVKMIDRVREIVIG